MMMKSVAADAYGCDTEYDDGEECPDFESKR